MNGDTVIHNQKAKLLFTNSEKKGENASELMQIHIILKPKVTLALLPHASPTPLSRHTMFKADVAEGSAGLLGNLGAGTGDFLNQNRD